MISSLCTADTSFFARTPTRSFTSSKVKRIRQANQKGGSGAASLFSQTLQDLLIVPGRLLVLVKNLIRPARQPCLCHVALDDILLKSLAPRTFKRPKVIARFAGLDVREGHR